MLKYAVQDWSIVYCTTDVKCVVYKVCFIVYCTTNVKCVVYKVCFIVYCTADV
jgi:hypothetical protein